ncbi:DnaA regulatory inactivator Hda [Aurantivibrio plasticivorans]
MVSDFPQQMSLGVSLHDTATFDNFFIPPDSGNAQVVSALLKQLETSDASVVYLWGASGAGLTHLLQASCHEAERQNISAQYLPLGELAGFDPAALLEGMAHFDLVCFDSIESVAGNPQWDEALFNCFNQLRDLNKKMLFASIYPPSQISVSLADLRSRLTWGETYQVVPLDDVEKVAALRSRAKGRGMVMSEEVGQFILNRAPRDMNDLFYLLDQLDEASLQEQRKLTIPFIKQVLKL